MAFKKLEAVVIGRVQGVGFRYFVERAANSLGITGWVCNLPDGNVKVLGVGTPANIAELIFKLQEGPEMSYIEDVKYTLENVDNNEYDSFTIKFY